MKRLKNISVGTRRFLAKKLKTLSKDKIEKGEERMKICNSCVNNIIGICSICGCVLALKTLSDTTCPEGRWEKVDNPSI